MSAAALEMSRPGLTADEIAKLPQRPIVFFDGVCGFCNASVDFVLRHEPAGRLVFAPLQGVTAEQLLTPTDREQLHSLVLWTPSRTFRKTGAVVRILWTIGGVWSLLGTLLWCVPSPLRDIVYTLVARNRYRLAGKKETCRMPTPEERQRFLP